jgi:hypothetical protein
MMKAVNPVKSAIATVLMCTVAFGVVLAPARAQQTGSMSDSDLKQQERLQVGAKQLDADGAAAAAIPEGRRRVTQTIAKQFNVEPSVVEGLRNRRLGYGGITIALALSEALMKQDKSTTRPQALDLILARRAAGQGWDQIAQSMGMKLGRLISEVQKADKQVEHLDGVKNAKAAQVDKPEKVDKTEKPDRPEKPGR